VPVLGFLSLHKKEGQTVGIKDEPLRELTARLSNDKSSFQEFRESIPRGLSILLIIAGVIIVFSSMGAIDEGSDDLLTWTTRVYEMCQSIYRVLLGLGFLGFGCWVYGRTSRRK